MGAAGSKLTQKGIQGLHKVKTAVDNLPNGEITPQMLDRILEEGSMTPKTDALLKQARERMEMEASQHSADSLLSYVQQKDDQFLSKLKGDLNALATDTITKEDVPIKSEGELPQDRSSTPGKISHISGKLTSDELTALFSHDDLIQTADGRGQLANLFDLPQDSVDSLLRYVALPKLEKRREQTKELDAVWPTWKKHME